MRKQNEKMAKAIRRVKDNPALNTEVKNMQHLSLEDQVKSQELGKIKHEIA